jgi:hypothetical protein
VQRLLGSRAALIASAAFAEPAIEAPLMTSAMNLADESVRDRVLANGPVGGWHTVPGTHSVLYRESIQFDVDGTGRMQSGGLSGTTTQPFLWRSAGHGMVECQPLDDKREVGEPEPEENDWLRIAFVIEQQATDVGEFWVLRETNSDGFWDLMTPLVPDN